MRKSPNEDQNTPVRRCILTGNRVPAEQLIRLALGPDNHVAPDIHARAEGRGAWVTASKALIRQAFDDGGLNKALSRAFKQPVTALKDDLIDQIERALSDGLLNRLGLEARASMLITGSDRISQEARMGGVFLLLHAGDAAANGRRELDQAWRVGLDMEGSGLAGLVLPMDRDALSVALGRKNTVHIALTDKKAAARVLDLAYRLLLYKGSDPADSDLLSLLNMARAKTSSADGNIVNTTHGAGQSAHDAVIAKG